MVLKKCDACGDEICTGDEFTVGGDIWLNSRGAVYCESCYNDIVMKWEEVYSIDCPVSIVTYFNGPCAYYQTQGGGPEGGYVLFDSDVYAVSRTWFQPWVSKLLKGKKLEFQVGDEMKGIPMRVRVF